MTLKKEKATKMRQSLLSLTLVALGGSGGCYVGVGVEADLPITGSDSADAASDSDGSGGSGDSGDSGDSGEPGDPPPEGVLERIGDSGLRRLSAAEYSTTVRDLLGVEVDGALLLPEDFRLPFDNDYTAQTVSKALISGAELLASDVAKLALEPGLRDATVGCTPAGPTDAACFQDFLTRFGRQALRRPMTEDELSRFGMLLSEAEESGDFYGAVHIAIRVLLQHPEFLYRVEIGTPVDGEPGVFELNDYEVATRLSYLFWGSTPNNELLDRADAGALSNPEDIRAAAEEMLLDERARTRIGRFHALWLGYETLPHRPELASAMRAETQALIDRVIFDDARPWQDLLRSESTYVDATLAEHYGLPAPAEPGWVDYGDTGRKGLLSHGSFLSSGANVGDTSPTKRGILVRTKLMCTVIPPPPPAANTDDVEPDPGTCKEDFYKEQHLAPGSGCQACHVLIDPIGFGLERYDKTGAFRTVQPDDENCALSGEGTVDGKDFSGPSELSDLLIDSGTLNRCVAEQFYRFAMGRSVLGDLDDAFIDFVVEQNGAEEDFDFSALLLSFASEEAFRYRRTATDE